MKNEKHFSGKYFKSPSNLQNTFKATLLCQGTFSSFLSFIFLFPCEFVFLANNSLRYIKNLLISCIYNLKECYRFFPLGRITAHAHTHTPHSLNPSTNNEFVYSSETAFCSLNLWMHMEIYYNLKSLLYFIL